MEGSCGIRELDADEGWRTGTFHVGGIFFFLSRGAEKDERSWNHLEHDAAGALELLGFRAAGSFGMRDTGLEVLGERDYPCGRGWICSCPVSVLALVTLW